MILGVRGLGAPFVIPKSRLGECPNKFLSVKTLFYCFVTMITQIIIRLFRIQYKTTIAEACYFFFQIALCKKLHAARNSMASTCACLVM